MSLSVSMLRKQIPDEHGLMPKICGWYRIAYRKLQKLGFKPIGRGKFVNGPFRVVISIMKCDAEYASGFVHIFGPKEPEPPQNLYKMKNIKFLTLNRFGKICKIPAENWDRNRKSIPLTKL